MRAADRQTCTRFSQISFRSVRNIRNMRRRQYCTNPQMKVRKNITSTFFFKLKTGLNLRRNGKLPKAGPLSGIICAPKDRFCFGGTYLEIPSGNWISFIRENLPNTILPDFYENSTLFSILFPKKTEISSNFSGTFQNSPGPENFSQEKILHILSPVHVSCPIRRSFRLQENAGGI